MRPRTLNWQGSLRMRQTCSESKGASLIARMSWSAARLRKVSHTEQSREDERLRTLRSEVCP